MGKWFDKVFVPDILSLKAVQAQPNEIRRVETVSETFSYPPAYYVFKLGATYTEASPAIIEDDLATGFWVMFPSPFILSAADPMVDSDLAGITWINTTTGDRFFSNPDLSWSPISGGSASLTTLTTTGFTQPSIDSTETINVVDSSTFIAGQYVAIETGGDYLITAVPSISQLTVQNLGGTNADPATAITTSKKVTPTGKPQNNSFYLGQMYFEGNTTATTIAATDTPVKIAGTTTASALNRNFTHANNRLTYSGIDTRVFMVSGFVLLESGNSHDLAVTVSKNGAAILGGKNIVTTSGAGLADSITLQALVELSNTDYIELWAENKTAVTDITAIELNLIIKAV